MSKEPDKSVFADLSHPEIISVLNSIDSSTSYYPIRSEAEVSRGGLTGESYHHSSGRRHSCSSYDHSTSSVNRGLLEGKVTSVPTTSLGGLPLVLLLYTEVCLTPRSLPQTMQLFVNRVGIIVNVDETSGWLSVMIVHEPTPLKVCITSKQASYLTPLVPAQGNLVRIIKGKYVGKMGRLFNFLDNKIEAIVEFNSSEMVITRIDQIVKLNASYLTSTYSRPSTLSVSSDTHNIAQSPVDSSSTNTYTCSSDFNQPGQVTTPHTSPTNPCVAMPTNHVIAPNSHVIGTQEPSNDLCPEPPQLINDAHMTSQGYMNDGHMTSATPTTQHQDYLIAPQESNGVCGGDKGAITPAPSPMSGYQHSPLPNAMSPTSPWAAGSHQNVPAPSPYNATHVLSPISPTPTCDAGTDQYATPNPSNATWTVGYTNSAQSNGMYGPNKTFLQPPHFVYIPTTCGTGMLPTTTPTTVQWPTAGITATYGADGKTYYAQPPSYVDHRTAMMTQYMLAAQVHGAYPNKSQYATPTTYANFQSLRSPRLAFAPSPFMSLPAQLPKTTTIPAAPVFQQSSSQASNKTEPKSTICDELKSLLCSNKSDDSCSKGIAYLKKNGCTVVIDKLLEKLEGLEAPPTWYDPFSKNDGDGDLSTKCIRVSANCPVTKQRMEYPCRGLHCSHLQCFDAKAFLHMVFKRKLASMGSQASCKPCPSGGWKCPICNKALTPKQLFIEKYLKKLISNSTATELEFQRAGVWEAVADDTKPANSSVIDLTLDSDDDG